MTKAEEIACEYFGESRVTRRFDEIEDYGADSVREFIVLLEKMEQDTQARAEDEILELKGLLESVEEERDEALSYIDDLVAEAQGDDW